MGKASVLCFFFAVICLAFISSNIGVTEGYGLCNWACDPKVGDCATLCKKQGYYSGFCHELDGVLTCCCLVSAL
ncbi:unnamed protein product [Cuscuta campestris]|uniref:Knottin scorpion toxin-like domain-containing protein n=1 Tax=Cuscuta campestris TaxID=132261 RepID=A0A484M6G8_9ASTE|nr:unnamed protein product [Cuscuta campestris]